MLSWIVMLGFFYWLFMLNLIFFVKCAKWLRYLQLEIPRVAISASGEKAFSRSYRVSSTNHMGYCQTMVKDQKKAFCGITRDRRLSETDVKERENCPGEDLNLHSLSATTPSRWRVYQFHHLGMFEESIKTLRKNKTPSGY